jgi:hypothetical protein
MVKGSYREGAMMDGYDILAFLGACLIASGWDNNFFLIFMGICVIGFAGYGVINHDK